MTFTASAVVIGVLTASPAHALKLFGINLFGSEEEMRAAMKLLQVPTELELFAGASHGLVQKRDGAAKVRDVAEKIARRFLALVGA